MKRVLIVMLGLAVVCAFSTASIAADEKIDIKSKTKTTASGKEITKTTEKVSTDATNIKMKDKSVTKGDVTIDKAKIVAKPKHGDTKKEYFKVISYNDNDPKNDSDNTVTVINSKEETLTMPVGKDIKINHLKGHKDKTVTIYSTYDINAKDWIVGKLAD